jgi:organic radical activating enzyme
MQKKFNDMDWKLASSGLPDNNPHNLEQINELLNSKGCGFCLAKFKQVTMHLGTGMTHSCHHPTPHKINANAVQENPHELFNTPTLKHARTEMLKGKRPSECDYCWRIEDDGGTSDRSYKSLESWAVSDFDTIVNNTGNEDLYPSYLEVSFSNACNLKCTYCGPEFSSSWVKELKEQGPLRILEETDNEQWVQGWQDLDTLNYKNREFNPYIDAFWKWFPEASKHLKHYRITGGEPLMNKETLRSMDYLIANPNRALEFSINSNFSVPDKLWDSFIDRLEKMRHDTVKKVTIYTSVESWGKQAEYSRSGLDFELLKTRVEQVLKMGNIRVVVMSAFNLLSITSFKDLLEWVLHLKKTYNPNNTIQHIEESTGFTVARYGDEDFTTRRLKNPDQSILVGIDIPYVRYPEFLDVQLCTHDLVNEFLVPALDFMCENTANSQWNDHQGFETWEVEKLKRIVHQRMYHNKKNDKERDTHSDIIKRRYQFLDFIEAIDRRRNGNFTETFSEMEAFVKECRKAKDHYLYSTMNGKKGKKYNFDD